jgi:1-deoxy-D-xylulose-5-phosphate synthase
MSYLRFIPNLTVMAPKDENELRDMLWTACCHEKGPVAIRYPRGTGVGVPLNPEFNPLPLGKGEILREGKQAAILAIGDRVYPALELGRKLEEKGITTRVVNSRFLRPLDRELIQDTLESFPVVCTLENNTIVGGFGSAVAEMVAELPFRPPHFHRFGLPDRFVPHGRICDLMEDVDLSMDKLIRIIENLFKENPPKKRKRSSLLRKNH